MPHDRVHNVTSTTVIQDRIKVKRVTNLALVVFLAFIRQHRANNFTRIFNDHFASINITLAEESPSMYNRPGNTTKKNEPADSALQNTPCLITDEDYMYSVLAETGQQMKAVTEMLSNLHKSKR